MSRKGKAGEAWRAHIEALLRDMDKNPSGIKKEESADMIKTSISLPRDLHAVLKLVAMKERKTLSELITEVMSDYVKKRGLEDLLKIIK